MKRTKIVCTLGPAVDDAATLARVCTAGMDVARFNFSHGDYTDQQKRIDLFKSVRDELKLPIAMMLDTKGPEIRIGTFKNGEIYLNDGAHFTLAHDNCDGDTEKVYVNYETLYAEVIPGATILINDGLIELKVEEIIDKDIKCLVTHGGKLTNRKSVNIPGLSLNFPLITEKDKADIAFGVENDFDMIAASFVRKAEDIRAIKNLLKELNAPQISVIAKIENQEGSYQTVSDGTTIYVGNNIKIDLGDKNVYLDDNSKLSLNEMTIDGNENINITPSDGKVKDDKKDNKGDAEGKDNTSNNPNGNGTDGKENTTPGNNGDNKVDGDENPDDNKTVIKKEVSVDLVSAKAGINSFEANFQVIDTGDFIKGNLISFKEF